MNYPQFSNVDHLDFSEIASGKPTQEFEIAQGREVGEYHVMYVCIISWGQ